MIRRFDDSRFRNDPCAELQADISALLDRELDDARVRRVLVHVEICPHCHRFLNSLRTQVDLHRHLWQEISEEETAEARVPGDLDSRAVEEDEDPFAGDLFADAKPEEAGGGVEVAP